MSQYKVGPVWVPEAPRRATTMTRPLGGLFDRRSTRGQAQPEWIDKQSQTGVNSGRG